MTEAELKALRDTIQASLSKIAGQKYAERYQAMANALEDAVGETQGVLGLTHDHGLGYFTDA